MIFEQLKKGDHVVVVYHGGRGFREVAVTKCGPKYFTADGHKFYRDTGCSVSGYSDPRAITLEQHAFEERYKLAEYHLINFGIRFDYSTGKDKVVLVHDALACLGALPQSSEGHEPK